MSLLLLSLRILALIAFLNSCWALFYTNSKENDYPRLGKRPTFYQNPVMNNKPSPPRKSNKIPSIYSNIKPDNYEHFKNSVIRIPPSYSTFSTLLPLLRKTPTLFSKEPVTVAKTINELGERGDTLTSIGQSDVDLLQNELDELRENIKTNQAKYPAHTEHLDETGETMQSVNNQDGVHWKLSLNTDDIIQLFKDILSES